MKVDSSKKYLFYLHGGVVQEYGINAVSKVYGPYEYLNILDRLKIYGYNVISERRPKGTDEIEYAEKISKQIDSLLVHGVASENIIVSAHRKGRILPSKLPTYSKFSISSTPFWLCAINIM